MLDYFKQQCEEHESVIYFALSSAASGQYQTANLVKSEIEEENPNADFHIVDTQKFSLYIAQTAVPTSRPSGTRTAAIRPTHGFWIAGRRQECSP